jgi:hypothetical protein
LGKRFRQLKAHSGGFVRLLALLPMLLRWWHIRLRFGFRCSFIGTGIGFIVFGSIPIPG